MVAALHSVVGLAAVLTSIGSVIGTAPDHISTLHLVTAYLGVLIGESYLLSLTGPASGLFADAVTVKVG
jgi:NAD/NADP transhydrogenase beta subunit